MRTDEIRDGKVLSVQLLRGVAASLVAFGHIKLGFASYVGAGFGVEFFAANLGALAVAVFFVISGYVMVVSSRQLFAADRGASHFLARRLIRILPPYWIVTLIMAAALVYQQEDFTLREVIASLAFYPVAERAHGWSPGYLLWPAWTLFFELLFYAIFAFAMLTGRSAGRTVAVASACLAVLAGIGVLLQPGSAVPQQFFQPVLILFVMGMALALWRERGGKMPGWLRWSCALAAILALPQMIGSGDLLQDPIGYVTRAGLPAVLVCVAMMGGPLRLPFGGLINRFGDISFALYLLHIPIAHFWIGSFRAIAPLGPWLFLLSACVLSVGASLAFYQWVERPMTRWLVRRLPGPGPVRA